ncbi:hypothetical protein [Pedobacter gandavensis]|uniref:hypothetical protein n=1 Tax=Pedobacter gandavensis TaxID=2679963 RepID=UPI0029305784|nr:hypothetical protein [Pedobacter gandavensis]
MKFKTLSIVLFCGFSVAKAQNLNKETAAIQSEGNMLYHSEMASWYGSDVLQSISAVNLIAI